MSEVTRILNAVKEGNPKAADELLPLVYNELRKLASAKMANEPSNQTLQPTALVHEAWIKLVGVNQGHWTGRSHFFAAAAESMRRILIDRARKRSRERHGGSLQRIDLSNVEIASETDDQTLLRLDEALLRFAKKSPEKADLVKLRYFAGLTIPDAAQALGISEATAKRHWTYARAWLLSDMSRTD